jgi:hypothetical protein
VNIGRCLASILAAIGIIGTLVAPAGAADLMVGSPTGITYVNPFTLTPTGQSIATPAAPKGITYGNGTVYATFADGVRRYSPTGGAPLAYRSTDSQLLWGALDFIPAGSGGSAGTLLMGFTNTAAPSFTGIDYLDPATLNDTGAAIYTGNPSAIVYAENSIYSGYASSIRRYSIAGAILGQGSHSTSWHVGPMAWGGGFFFDTFTDTTTPVSAYGINFMNPATLADVGKTIPTTSMPRGLVYDNNSLYASFANGALVRYDLSGNVLGSTNLGNAGGGPLAVVPEPSALATLLAATVAAHAFTARLRRTRRGNRF